MVHSLIKGGVSWNEKQWSWNFSNFGFSLVKCALSWETSFLEKKKKGWICTICWLLWCTYSHHNWFQGTKIFKKRLKKIPEYLTVGSFSAILSRLLYTTYCTPTSLMILKVICLLRFVSSCTNENVWLDDPTFCQL